MSKITNVVQVQIPETEIRKRIYSLRDTQVMLDGDLAQFYGVELKVLKQSIKRNIQRLPEDFMWVVTDIELERLRSQIVTQNSEKRSKSDAKPQIRSQIVTENSKGGFEVDTAPQIRSQIVIEMSGSDSLVRRGHRYAPFVFTELGVAMLSSVLHSPRAVQISIEIIRLFIQLRDEQRSHGDVMARLDSMEAALNRKLDRIDLHLRNPIRATDASARSDAADKILSVVAEYFGLCSEDLKSASRMQPISLARQIAVFFMRKYLGMGFSEIGRYLGDRDHSTILHAYRKIHVDSEDNASVRKSVTALFKEIQPLLA